MKIKSNIRNYYQSFNFMDPINITIEKPLYSTFVNIRDIYLKQAISQGRLLRITIPQGTALHDPREWVRTGKVHKQVFRIKNKPMILYGNFVNVPIPQVEEVENSMEQLSLL